MTLIALTGYGLPDDRKRSPRPASIGIWSNLSRRKTYSTRWTRSSPGNTSKGRPRVQSALLATTEFIAVLAPHGHCWRRCAWSLANLACRTPRLPTTGTIDSRLGKLQLLQIPGDFKKAS